MGKYSARHLWLKFQRSTNQNYDCPRFPLSLNVAGVYIGLSSKMSIPNSFIMQYPNNCTMNPVLKGVVNMVSCDFDAYQAASV